MLCVEWEVGWGVLKVRKAVRKGGLFVVLELVSYLNTSEKSLLLSILQSRSFKSFQNYPCQKTKKNRYNNSFGILPMN